MDDFDVEKSSRNTPPDTTPDTPAATPPARSHDTGPPASRDTSALTPLSAPIATRVSGASRRTLTQRLLRAGSLLVLLSVLVSAFLLVLAGNRPTILSLLAHPTPTATAIPRSGDDTFLWEHSVPWGRLLIDGQPGPDVGGSALHQDAEGVPRGAAFHLARGRHTLEYRAAPFPTLRCTLSVPATRIDTCPLNRAADLSFLVPDAPLTRLLDLQATIDRLPEAQAQALLAATQAQLTSLAAAFLPGMLTVGDHYLDSAGQLTQASAALTFAPRIRLESTIDRNDDVVCVTLCSNTSLFTAYSAEVWALLAPVALTWRYTTTAGQVVLADGPAGALEARGSTPMSIVAQWRDGSWQIQTPLVGSPQPDPVICPTGEHYREALQVTPGQTTVHQNFHWPYVASTAELGCLYAGSEMDPTTGQPSGPIALVLYRAGALLAVNAAAHQVFPTLPLVSAHERALAQAVAPTSLGGATGSWGAGELRMQGTHRRSPSLRSVANAALAPR
jgi:hypothetical protein